MSIATSSPPELLPLRPAPWPVTPYGPYRLVGDGTLEQFHTTGPRVIRWIERHCVFTGGRWVGQPFRLLPWQRQLLIDLFEMVWDERLNRWRRRYRTAYIGVPKKQGKTELAAALACYFLLGAGEPSPGVAVAAAADYQADLVFRAAATMIELSPTLNTAANIFQREIIVPGVPNARMRRVAAAGGKLDGMRLLVAICDEVHEWLTPNQRKVYGMLSGALAVADEPLHLSITTAGEDLGDEDDDEVPPWLRLYRLGRRIEAGEIHDDAFLFRWWMAEPGCDYRDLSVYARPDVNPSYGVTVQEAFYRHELTKRTESELRRYYLNQPVETVNIWLQHGAWEACQVEFGPPPADWLADDPRRELWPILPGEPCWLGWDASTRRDSTAVVLVQWQDIEGQRRLVVRSRVWERPLGPDGSPIPDWRVPRADILDYLDRVFSTLTVQAGGYDPWAIAWVVEEMEDRGWPLVAIPQQDTRMCPATQRLYELVVDGELAHDGDPVLARHIRSARVKHVPRGGQRLVKGADGRGRRIDAAVALVVAISAMGGAAEDAGYGIYIAGDDDETYDAE